LSPEIDLNGLRAVFRGSGYVGINPPQTASPEPFLRETYVKLTRVVDKVGITLWIKTGQKG
jgi:hypothetical protein